MKIAHMLWSFSTGGIETMLVDIVNEQVKNVEVAIFIINKKYDKSLLAKFNKNVEIYLINRNEAGKNPWPIIRMNYLLYKYKPDIIHIHSNRIINIVWGKYHFARTIHDTFGNGLDYNRFERLFCISNAVKKYTADLGYPNGITIYNGIHCEAIAHNENVSVGLHNPIRIVCVGRLHPMKGQNILIDAMDILVNQKDIENVTLDLIGDGDFRKTIEDEIQKKKLYNHVRLLGTKPREYIYAKLKDYDLFVVPSVSEGFGLALAEACCAKISVLTCDLEGPMEVVDYGKFGRHFKCGDCVSLAEELECFIRNGINPEQVGQAYEYVKNNFDISVTSKKYLEEYQKLLY